MKILIFLTFAVGADLTTFLIPESCEYQSYRCICTNITTAFPAMNYNCYSLECKNCSINVFSIDTFPFTSLNIGHFNVSASHIENVTSMAFSKFANTYITRIDLQENDIVNISADAFYGIKVEELHLYGNKLVELTPGFMNGLRVDVITMYNNKLRDIPEDVFRGIIYATSIDLSSNEIESLYTDSFRHLTTLTHLNLHHNKLLTLPVDVFKHTAALTNLDLSGNNLRGLPLGIFSLTQHLSNLNVSSNKMFGNFDMNVLLPTQITTLDVSTNDLRPDHFKNVHLIIPSLSYLALNENFWQCGDLIKTIGYLKSHRIDVSQHPLGRYDVTNLYGIVCHESLQQYLEQEKATANDL